jgi:hypothetical protein
LNSLLDSFVLPTEIFGKDIKIGYYYYCNFPKNYGEEDIGWLRVKDSINFPTQHRNSVILAFEEISPIILDGEEKYLVKIFRD